MILDRFPRTVPDICIGIECVSLLFVFVTVSLLKSPFSLNYFSAWELLSLLNVLVLP